MSKLDTSDEGGVMRYKVSPTDLSDLRLGEADTVEAILRNIAIILSTPKNSVPLYREFGIPWDFVDKPMPVAKAMMVAPVREALERWEPGAALVDIDFKQDPSRPGTLIPIVEVEISDEQES